MANDQVSAVSAAIKSLDSGAFVTLRSRLDRGGALQARRLANGVVQLYWRYSLGSKTSREPRHYDGHDYMPDKRSALEILSREIQAAD